MIRLITLLFVFSAVTAFGQDVHYSQYEKAPMLLNPAMAGMGKGYNRASLNYRNQWPQLGSTYKTSYASIDFPILSEKMKFRNTRFGTGLHFYTDKAGDSKFTTLHTGLSMSAIISIDRNQRISGGLQGAFVQKSYDASGVTWDNQFNGYEYDPSLSSGELFLQESRSYLDMAAGIHYKYFSPYTTLYGIESNSAEAGISINHLLKTPNLLYQSTDLNLYRRWSVYGKGLLTFHNRPFGFEPHMRWTHQGPHDEVVIGTSFNYYIKADTRYTGFIKQTYIGVDLKYRVGDAVIPSVHFKFNDFLVGLSYDYNISDLKEATGGVGGFEISLKFIDTYGTLFNQGNKHIINSSNGNLSL